MSKGRDLYDAVKNGEIDKVKSLILNEKIDVNWADDVVYFITTNTLFIFIILLKNIFIIAKK